MVEKWWKNVEKMVNIFQRHLFSERETAEMLARTMHGEELNEDEGENKY